MVRISSVNKLSVLYREQIVGTLAMTTDGKCCTFQYDSDWLRTGFSISPLDLPLRADMFIAKPTPFYGNFGIFEDSLPDGYGRYLLNRMLRNQGIDDLSLTPLQRLSIVGSTGMGALCYVPEQTLQGNHSIPELHTLQQLAIDVLQDKNIQDADVLYFNSGNSGGCRPKCLLTDETGHWLVKFRHTYDPQDMGQDEYHYNELAQQCGIDVPNFRLIEGKYFASRRFDLSPTGERLHAATAAALLNESINPPKADYKTILALTGYLTQDPQQVEQMFRRMVFNVLIENKDDHAKNFSFICQNGKWILAPAYDLTRCAQGYNGEHATSVMGKGNPTTDDMLVAGESIRIPRKRGREIIQEMTAIIK